MRELLWASATLETEELPNNTRITPVKKVLGGSSTIKISGARPLGIVHVLNWYNYML
jgi:hypothetical protein